MSSDSSSSEIKVLFFAWKNTLTKYGYELSSKSYHELFDFKFAPLVLRNILPFCTLDDVFNIAKQKEQEFCQLVQKGKLKTVKGLRTLMQDINTQKTPILAVLVTDLTIRETQSCLENVGLGSAFDMIFSNFGIQQVKPSPEIYKIAIKKLEVEPSQCVAFEASLAGICSAKLANISNIIGIDVTSDNSLQMINEGAKACLTDFKSFKFQYIKGLCMN